MKKIILLLMAAACTATAQITNVNVGSAANAGDGDTLRAAFSKLNANDNYLNGREGAGATNNYYSANEPATNAIAVTDGSGRHFMLNPTSANSNSIVIISNGTPFLATTIPPAQVSTNGSGAGQILMSRGGQTVWTNSPYQLLWVYTNTPLLEFISDTPALFNFSTNGTGTNILSTSVAVGTVYRFEILSDFQLNADADASIYFTTNNVIAGEIYDFMGGTSSSEGNATPIVIEIVYRGGNSWNWSSYLFNAVDALNKQTSGQFLMTSDFKLGLNYQLPNPDNGFFVVSMKLVRLSP